MKTLDKLANLYEQKRELTILQGFYFIIAVVSLFVAGIIALVNQSVGVAILVVPLAAISIFGINLVCWALIRLYLDSVKSKKSKESKSSSTK